MLGKHNAIHIDHTETRCNHPLQSDKYHFRRITIDPFEETAESVYRIGDNYEENGDFYGDFSLQGTVEEVGFADTAFDDVEDFRIVANAALQAAGTGVDIDALILALGT